MATTVPSIAAAIDAGADANGPYQTPVPPAGTPASVFKLIGEPSVQPILAVKLAKAVGAGHKLITASFISEPQSALPTMYVMYNFSGVKPAGREAINAPRL